MMIENLKKRIEQAICDNADEIIKIGEDILNMPELGYREEKTSGYVRNVFERLEMNYSYCDCERVSYE